MGKLNHEPRFLHRALEKSALLSQSLGIISLDYDGVLAYSTLIIDYFLHQANKANDEAVERLLSILTLFEDTPNYPRPGKKSYITPSEYLQQLCLASDNATRLTSLLRAIASAVKRIAINEILSNAQYYQMMRSIAKAPLNITALQQPLAINPYLDNTLCRAIGLNFTRFEINGTKLLARQSPIPCSNLTQPALIINWHQDQCLVSAQVLHSAWFASLTPEIIHADLKTHKESYASCGNYAALSPSKLCQKEIMAHYLRIKRRYDHLSLPLYELQQIYSMALDHLIEKAHEVYHGMCFGSQRFFEDKLALKMPFSPDKTEVALEARIQQELNNALARLESLRIISDLTVAAPNHEKKSQEISYKINRQ
jgi:hypothetical protein